ncbi:MAG: RNA polymerase sigma factor [candidate division Zixibacteria bacterium]|nr:RNA polymerase sigma factor [candidate division Zixibacteria bacterium]
MDQLLALARQGDKEAQEKLFEFLLVRFTLLAKRRMREEEARDAAQDACLTVFQKYLTEAPTERFEAWAYGVLRRKIGNCYQKRDVRSRVMGAETGIDDVADVTGAVLPSHVRRVLLECLRKLVREFPRYARAVNLVYQGYDTEEVCRRLRIRQGYVYVLLNRGRDMLSDCIDKGGIR